MSLLREAAPAKINLGLAVVGRRDDGYHSLRSVFMRLAVHDDLSVDAAPDADRDTLEVPGDSAGRVEDNLVLRAVTDLRAAADEPLTHLRFELTKRIPVGAGLGGGSSDAAAAMNLALAAWGVRLHPAARLGAAMRLGADVPFFAAGHGAALAGGIGENLEPLPVPTSAAGVVLVTSRQRLSTAKVFAKLDGQPPPDAAAEEAVLVLAAAMRDGIDGPDLVAFAPRLRDANDLWTSAERLSPGLGAARGALESHLGRPAMLTGSGPTLYAIYPSPSEAADAAAELEIKRPSELKGATIIATTTGGSS